MDQEIFWEACEVGLTKGCPIWDLLFILETQLKIPCVKVTECDNRGLRLALKTGNPHVVSFLLDYSNGDDTPIEKLSDEFLIDYLFKFLVLFTNRVDLCDKILKLYPKHYFKDDIKIIWKSLTPKLCSFLQEKQLRTKLFFLLDNRKRLHFGKARSWRILSEFCIERPKLIFIIRKRYHLPVTFPLIKVILLVRISDIMPLIINIDTLPRLYHLKTNYKKVIPSIYGLILKNGIVKQMDQLLLIVKRIYPVLFPVREYCVLPNPEVKSFSFLLLNNFLELSETNIDMIIYLIGSKTLLSEKNNLLELLWNVIPKAKTMPYWFYSSFITRIGQDFLHEKFGAKTKLMSIKMALECIERFHTCKERYRITHRLIYQGSLDLSFWDETAKLRNYPTVFLQDFIQYKLCMPIKPETIGEWVFLLAFLKILRISEIEFSHYFKLARGRRSEEKWLRLLKTIDILSQCYVSKDYEWIKAHNIGKIKGKFRKPLMDLYSICLRRQEIVESDKKCSGKTKKDTECKYKARYIFNKKFYCGIHIKKKLKSS